MSVVILARQVVADGSPQPVHAYPVPAESDVATLRAACGHTLERGYAQQVSAFVGAPCTPCLLLLSSCRDEPDAVTVGRDEPALPAADEIVAHGRYAVGLRGENVVHLVPQRPITGDLDGRSVVQTVCGCLAWGPLPSSQQRPICGECEAMPEERIK